MYDYPSKLERGSILASPKTKTLGVMWSGRVVVVQKDSTAACDRLIPKNELLEIHLLPFALPRKKSSPHLFARVGQDPASS